MVFRTEINPNALPFNLLLSHQGMCIGSCFSLNIGHKLQELGFDTILNPYGILFNPYSVGQCLEDVIVNNRSDKNDLVEANDLWHSWKHHGRFSDRDQNEVLKKINTSLSEAHEKLKSLDFLIITFGSAWVYRHHRAGIVANCHKIANKQFEKELLSIDDIVNQWQRILKLLSSNKDLKIIFSLSPVRHWKDGAEGNSLSKAVLRTAIHRICDTYSNAFYFPAYELLLDDLRDYRWFNDDMLHPSPKAMEYIWNKFSVTVFNSRTLTYLKEKEQINRLKSHKGIKEEVDHASIVAKERILIEKYRDLFNASTSSV